MMPWIKKIVEKVAETSASNEMTKCLHTLLRFSEKIFFSFGSIIGIVFGCFFFFAVLMVIVCVCIARRNVYDMARSTNRRFVTRGPFRPFTAAGTAGNKTKNSVSTRFTKRLLCQQVLSTPVIVLFFNPSWTTKSNEYQQD